MKWISGMAAALLASTALPAHAMKGCDFADGSSASIAFALRAIEARQNGYTRDTFEGVAPTNGTDPVWYASMVSETLDEVYSDLPPVEGNVYSAYRGFVCYHASKHPDAVTVADYATVHPLLKACELQAGPFEQMRCGTDVVDRHMGGKPRQPPTGPIDSTPPH